MASLGHRRDWLVVGGVRRLLAEERRPRIKRFRDRWSYRFHQEFSRQGEQDVVGMTLRFENDDRAYLEWLRDNPSGYVLNIRATPDPGSVVLHRAPCRSISSDRGAANAYTGAGYRKICSNDIDELARFYAGRSPWFPRESGPNPEQVTLH